MGKHKRRCPTSPPFPPHREKTMKIQVRPRLQKDKWSLYWRTSMSTVTEKLDDFTLDVDPSMKVEDFQAKVAEQMGWEPVEMLLRLEGFVEPWELAMLKGCEMNGEST